jgi:phenylacetate-coenzyme A ligase PaaK-like adenylate-forming protein
MIPTTPLEGWISGKIGRPGTRGRLAPSEIRRFQVERINLTLSHAREKSPFYRERLRTLGKERIRRLEDLSGLPFTTPADVASDPLRFLCVSQSEIERIVTLRSSATTGLSKRIFLAADDLESTVDFFHHGMSTLVRPGYRVLILMPGETPASIGDLLQRALARMGVKGLLHGPVVDPAETVRFIIDHAVDALVGVPTQVLALARVRGTRMPGHRIKSVLLSTDYLPRAIVRALKNAWRCDVFDHYGMTEMGWGGGVECAAHRGYHLREADLYVEIADPETGEPCREGETGEVVFTTLSRRGMPLIRYRTGDVALFHRTPCPCGSLLRTLARVGFRLGGEVKLAPDVTLTMAQLDEALFPLSSIVDFSAEINSHEGVQELSLEVVHNGERSREITGGTITERLASLPPIAAALGSGAFRIGPIRFREMGAFPLAFRKRRLSVRQGL